MKIANKLRQRSAELGLDNAEVARKSNISERTYAYYVEGRSNPPFDKFINICKTLQVAPNYFFEIPYERTAQVNEDILERSILETIYHNKRLNNVLTDKQLAHAIINAYLTNLEEDPQRKSQDAPSVENQKDIKNNS